MMKYAPLTSESAQLGRPLTHWCVACLALTLLALVGCTTPPKEHAWRYEHAQRVIEHRNQAVLYAPQRYIASEQSRPHKLMRTADQVGSAIALDVHRTSQLPDKIGHYLDRDIRRWCDKQPVYLMKAAQTLGGKPAVIPANAVMLFY
ncbi:MAG: hypothetical protein JXO22_09825 [Phycisphaerae bacterium]|nr:hypothetical protein [Phycisphaerae bacterium]